MLGRLAVTVLYCAAVCAGMSAPVTMQQLQAYLYQYGYLPSTDLSRGVKRSASDLEQATKRLQKFVGLEVTGQLDQATMDLIHTPRCGIRDMEVSDYNGQLMDSPSNSTLLSFKLLDSPSNFTVSLAQWEKTQMPLKYYYINYTPALPQSTIRSEMEESFALWTGVSGLSTEEVGEESSADISIMFGGGQHGNCHVPFDGPSGILAHAFSPPVGDLHFDDDENLTSGTATGINFQQVAVHELGHSFGLKHSTVQGATMFPYYSYSEAIQLHEDDIAGIQLLYGSA